jgi:hypothetical protein
MQQKRKLSSSAKVKNFGSFTFTSVQRFILIIYEYILFNYALNSSDLLRVQLSTAALLLLLLLLLLL